LRTVQRRAASITALTGPAGRVAVSSSASSPPIKADLGGLVLGVGADRRDAVLRDTDEHELAAGTHEVQRAAGLRTTEASLLRPRPTERSSRDALT